MTLVDTREAAGRSRSAQGSGRRVARSVPADRASRSKAAQRALDRRSRRELGGTRLRMSGRRIAGVPVVVPILALVLGALALTLFLTTRSAQDSYAIDSVREQNQDLQATVADLKGKADLGDSAPALADAAARLGMVPADSPAQLIVGADGKARLRGDLSPASGSPLPALNPAPDPVEKIDKSKVDDSLGLGGDEGGRSQTTPSAPSTPDESDAVDDRDPAGPSTNVLPTQDRPETRSATPRPNPAPAR